MEDITKKPRKWKERWFDKEKTIQAEAPTEEQSVPDTPVNEAKKLMDNKDYFSLIQLVLKNNLQEQFDVRELASNLTYGNLFYISENYNISLNELVSDEMIGKLKDDIKGIGGLFEERRLQPDDFLKTDIFQKIMRVGKALNFDVLGFLKEQHPDAFYQYPTYSIQDKSVEEIKKLREIRMTDSNHREFPYKIIKMTTQPGGSSSDGRYSYAFAINSTDDIFPVEIFSTLNKHDATGDKPVAFITGTYTPKEVLYVDEMQSDVIQRAQMYLQDPKEARVKFQKRIDEINHKYKNMEMPADAKKRIEKDEKNKDRINTWSSDFMPQYKQYRSKIQNYFSGWNIMAMNAILNFAQEHEIPTVFVRSADSLEKQWLGSYGAGEFTKDLYERIYDNMVQSKYNATREGDWWKISLQDVQEKIAHKQSVKKYAIRNISVDAFLDSIKVILGSESGILFEKANMVEEAYNDLNFEIVSLEHFSFVPNTKIIEIPLKTIDKTGLLKSPVDYATSFVGDHLVDFAHEIGHFIDYTDRGCDVINAERRQHRESGDNESKGYYNTMLSEQTAILREVQILKHKGFSDDDIMKKCQSLDLPEGNIIELISRALKYYGMTKFANYEELYKLYPIQFDDKAKEKLLEIPEVKQLVDEKISSEDWNKLTIGFWDNTPFYDDIKKAIYYPNHFLKKLMKDDKPEEEKLPKEDDYAEELQQLWNDEYKNFAPEGSSEEERKQFEDDYKQEMDFYINDYAYQYDVTFTNFDMCMMLHELNHYADHLERGEQFTSETTGYWEDEARTKINMEKYRNSVAEQKSFLTEAKYLKSKGLNDEEIIRQLSIQYGGEGKYWANLLGVEYKESTPINENWKSRWLRRASMKKKAYWSVVDDDLEKVMEVGKNSETLEQAVEEMLSYLSPDIEAEDEETINSMTLEEKVGYISDLNFTFYKHETDDYYNEQDTAIEYDPDIHVSEERERKKKNEEFEERWQKFAQGQQIWIDPSGKEYLLDSSVGHSGFIIQNTELLNKQYDIDVNKFVNEYEGIADREDEEMLDLLLKDGWVRISGLGSIHVWDVRNSGIQDILVEFMTKHSVSDVMVDFTLPRRQTITLSKKLMDENGISDTINSELRFLPRSFRCEHGNALKLVMS